MTFYKKKRCIHSIFNRECKLMVIRVCFCCPGFFDFVDKFSGLKNGLEMFQWQQKFQWQQSSDGKNFQRQLSSNGNQKISRFWRICNMGLFFCPSTKTISFGCNSALHCIGSGKANGETESFVD